MEIKYERTGKADCKYVPSLAEIVGNGRAGHHDSTTNDSAFTANVDVESKAWRFKRAKVNKFTKHLRLVSKDSKDLNLIRNSSDSCEQEPLSELDKSSARKLKV